MRTLRRGSDELVELVDREFPAESTESRVWAVAEVDDFDSFYRREFPPLVVLARVLAGPTSAHDVAQEAMLVACHKWHLARGYESPVCWLRTVCMHKAVALVRRRKLERRVLWQLGASWAQDPPVVGEDERFWQAVRDLPLRQTQVVALHYALDLPVAEVADTLRCAERTVEAHLARARSALATTLGVPEEGKAWASTP